MQSLNRGAPVTSAVIIVRDPALAISLEFTLQACGLRVAVCDPSTDLNSVPPTALLVVDRALLPLKAKAANASLQQVAPGRAIVLTEDGARGAEQLPISEHLAVVEMPFSSADLIAILAAFTTQGTSTSK